MNEDICALSWQLPPS